MRDPGSVALVPIIRRDVVLGALVLEAHEVGDFGPDITEELAVLLAVAAGSLEMAWPFGEVDKRCARRIALTGLWNRMHFGEQLDARSWRRPTGTSIQCRWCWWTSITSSGERHVGPRGGGRRVASAWPACSRTACAP